MPAVPAAKRLANVNSRRVKRMWSSLESLS
jgi:hypothetical protein